MKKALGIGILSVTVIAGACGLLAVIFSVSTYNGLVGSEELVRSKWAQVENQMQRRLDLIPNLVETVKGFSGQEKDILLGLAEARTRYLGAATLSGKVSAMNACSRQLAAVVTVAENHPQLQSNANFRALMDELTGTENRLAVERKRFNDTVADYNTKCRRFPSNLIAGLTGFERIESFEAQAGAANAPKVKF
jgi:LemA protein